MYKVHDKNLHRSCSKYVQLILLWGSAFPENLEQSTVEHCAFAIDRFFIARILLITTE